MTLDEDILRIMLRLARRREPADTEALVARAGALPCAVRSAIRRLEARGWVERPAHRAPRLSLTGFAIAVAMLPSKAHGGVRATVHPSRAA
jgi:Mn-dependent DtxR family transcriptional regulator